MRHMLRYFTAAFLMLSACAPGGVGQGFSTLEMKMVVKDLTPEKPVPEVQPKKSENYEIIRGATKNHNLAVSYAADIKRMILRGELELTPIGNNQKPLQIPIDLAGLADEKGYVYLKSYDPQTKSVPGVRLGSKATCLGPDRNCATSFIDIYVEFEGNVYHHQLRSSPVKSTAPAQPSTQANDPKKEDKPKADAKDDHDHGGDIFDEESDGAEEGELEGQYVGSPVQDIENILGLKPTPPAQEAPPKKDVTPPKKQEPVSPPPKGAPLVVPQIDLKKVFSVKDQAITIPADPKEKRFVDTGFLENGIDMYKVERSILQPGFKILRPERGTQFATSDLGSMIIMMAELTKKILPGNFLAVGDLSTAKGGRQRGHLSHQNGLDADIAYYFDNLTLQNMLRFTPAVKTQKRKNIIQENWMMQEQWVLFKAIVATKKVKNIFAHQTIKNALCAAAIKSGELVKGQNSLAAETLSLISHETGHGNHFHLRLKCSDDQPRCFIEKKKDEKEQKKDSAPEPIAASGCFDKK